MLVATRNQIPLDHGETIPQKISVLPNVVGHLLGPLITFGLSAVPARKASNAGQGMALRKGEEMTSANRGRRRRRIQEKKDRRARRIC